MSLPFGVRSLLEVSYIYVSLPLDKTAGFWLLPLGLEVKNLRLTFAVFLLSKMVLPVKSWLLVTVLPLTVSALATRNGHVSGLAVPKIDTHSHVYPDFYRAAVIAAGWTPGPDGNAAPPVRQDDSPMIFRWLTQSRTGQSKRISTL